MKNVSRIDQTRKGHPTLH